MRGSHQSPPPRGSYQIRAALAEALQHRNIIQLELELIQTQMTQKPMLRAEVFARALRASQKRGRERIIYLIYLKHGLDASPAPPPGQHRGL